MKIYVSHRGCLYPNNLTQSPHLSLRKVRINCIDLGKYDGLELNAQIILVCQSDQGIICLSVRVTLTRMPDCPVPPHLRESSGWPAERDLDRLHTTRSAGLPFFLPDQYRRIRLTIFP